MNGLSKQKISSQLHIAEKYVRQILNERNLNRQKRKELKENEIIEFYKIDRNRTETAKKFNISVTTVSKILKENKIKTKNSKHTFDMHVFDSIDTEDKAY